MPSKLHDLIYLRTYFFGVDPDPPLTLIYYLLPKTLMGHMMIRLPKTGFVFLEAVIIPSTKYNCIIFRLVETFVYIRALYPDLFKSSHACDFLTFKTKMHNIDNLFLLFSIHNKYLSLNNVLHILG